MSRKLGFSLGLHLHKDDNDIHKIKLKFKMSSQLECMYESFYLRYLNKHVGDFHVRTSLDFLESTSQIFMSRPFTLLSPDVF